MRRLGALPVVLLKRATQVVQQRAKHRTERFRSGSQGRDRSWRSFVLAQQRDQTSRLNFRIHQPRCEQRNTEARLCQSEGDLAIVCGNTPPNARGVLLAMPGKRPRRGALAIAVHKALTVGELARVLRGAVSFHILWRRHEAA